MARTGYRLQVFLLITLVAATVLLAPAPCKAQIEIPGLRPGSLVEAWTEGQHVILRVEDGRLFSIPLTTPGIDRALEGLSSAAAPPAGTVTISDIIDMLRAGISEATIKAHIQASGEETVDLERTKDNLIALKQAGASEAFLQYLIRLGQKTPKTTLIRWGKPSWPPRPVQDTPAIHQPAESVSYQEGIPLYPYVFPGYGVSYPHSRGYGCFRYHRQNDEASKNRAPYRRRMVYPKTESYRQGANGGLLIRWNGPRQGGGGRAGMVNRATPSTSSSGQMSPPTRSSSFRKTFSSRGAPRATSKRGQPGRPATGHSRSLGSRSLFRKR